MELLIYCNFFYSIYLFSRKWMWNLNEQSNQQGPINLLSILVNCRQSRLIVGDPDQSSIPINCRWSWSIVNPD